MKRREALALLGGVAAASAAGPSALWAQQKALPVIAYMSGRSLVTDSHLLAAFREGLKEVGFIDGQNVTMDVRWADGQYDRIPGLMAETVKARPDLIVALGGNQLGLAAKAATSTIPVVFGTGADPVSLGLVSSLGRPDGNLTGMSAMPPVFAVCHVLIKSTDESSLRAGVSWCQPCRPARPCTRRAAACRLLGLCNTPRRPSNAGGISAGAGRARTGGGAQRPGRGAPRQR